MADQLTRVLIVYSSGSGCTTSIARRIGEDLIAYQCAPQVVDVSQNPQITPAVDAVIFGSSTRVGKWGREAMEWLQANRGALESRPFAVFSVGLLSVTDDAAKIHQAQADLLREIKRISPLVPFATTLFSGWKEPDRFSSVERLALKIYPLEDGDYRDWDEIDTWVHDIAPGLRGQRAHEQGPRRITPQPSLTRKP